MIINKKNKKNKKNNVVNVIAALIIAQIVVMLVGVAKNVDAVGYFVVGGHILKFYSVLRNILFERS